MTTGELIRAARKKAGLTQKQLGDLCGIAEPTIRRYELGKLNPKRETLQKISKPLDVPWYELYSDSTEEQIELIHNIATTENKNKQSNDSEFIKLFKHPVIQSLAKTIVDLDKERQIWFLESLRHINPEEWEKTKFTEPDKQELERRIRNTIIFALLENEIRPSGYEELLDLGFPIGDATYYLNYEKDNIAGTGVKSERQIMNVQTIIHRLNNMSNNKED